MVGEGVEEAEEGKGLLGRLSGILRADEKVEVKAEIY